MQLVIVRHAEAAPGAPDALRPLTPTGHKHAEALGAELREQGIEPDAVVSSPLVRARETAEDLGLGWVSFYREEHLRDLLRIPEHVRPVAWLCVGPVRHLEAIPDLERHGWRTRLDLATVVHHDRW